MKIELMKIFNNFIFYNDFTDSSSLAKWSSLELLSEEDLDTGSPTYIENNRSGEHLSLSITHN